MMVIAKAGDSCLYLASKGGRKRSLGKFRPETVIKTARWVFGMREIWSRDSRRRHIPPTKYPACMYDCIFRFYFLF
jgi:hypothetical protein